MDLLSWKKNDADFDFEDKCDKLQEWESKKTLLETDLLCFGFYFCITKRKGSNYNLYVYYLSKSGKGPLYMEIKGIGTLRAAKAKAKEILETFSKISL